MVKRLKIGVSSCLLGEKVRYDGADKRDPDLIDTLGRLFTLVGVCPEVGCGLPVPREPMRLEGDPSSPRLITIESRIDLTGQLLNYCVHRVAELEREGICGFILKKNSPSCGLQMVQLYQGGEPSGHGRGLFAAQLVRRFPLLPIAEEEILGDPVLRDNFMSCVLAYSGAKETR
jgi:uncharacterized protein YbbK (DUF523 family)